MPGLIGWWTSDKGEIDPALFGKMAESMRHRPELLVEIASIPGFSGGRVHLGYLQRQPQPVSDASSRYHLWFDGELTNAPDLQREYQLDGSAGATDPELALALFQRVGWSFLLETNGIFNIALYDSDARELTLVNDRFGLRPLYWTRMKHAFAYAGELKAIACTPAFESRIDRQTVSDNFTFGTSIGASTWLENVQLLPPATVLKTSAQGVSQKRYWSWDDLEPLPPRMTEDEIIEELVRLCKKSVALAVDDLRLGILLSGGLDSRCLAAALPALTKPCQAITFGDEGSLDLRIARRVSAVLGLPHHFAPISPQNWLEPRIRSVWHTDAAASIFDMHGAEALPLVADLCQVALDGFAGDVGPGGLFVPYGDPEVFIFKQFYHQGELSASRDEAQNRMLTLRRQGPSRPSEFLYEHIIGRITNAGVVSLRPFVEPRLPFCDVDFFTFVGRVPYPLRKNSRIYKKMLLTAFPDLFRDIPWQRTGLPIGKPFWHLRAPEMALLAQQTRLYKGLARRVGLPLPYEKLAFVDNVQLVTSEPARGFIKRLLLDGEALHSSYVDPDRARSIATRFISGDRQMMHEGGLLLTFELYLRQLFDRSSLDEIVNLCLRES